MRFVSRPTPFALVQEQVREIEQGLSQHDMQEIKTLLRSVVPEYQPDPPAPAWAPPVGVCEQHVLHFADERF
jgi:hypothetical protein